MIEQKVYDAQDSYAYTLKWDYDLHGNLISETNVKGETRTKTYDLATDNLIQEETLSGKILKTYDFADRLIAQKEIHPDGQEFTQTCTYDYLSNSISSIDFYGHETRHVYDDFGRVIETYLPEIPNEEGFLVTPITKKSYDIAGNPICLTDALGRETYLEYNIRGQPTKITYPDSTTEEMIYDVTGQLRRKKAKNDVWTEFTRDPMGRIILETISSGTEQKQIKNQYNAFHLMQSEDPEGTITTYFYDKAGRLKETCKHNRKVENIYDSLGRLREIREYYGDKSTDYRASAKKYDELDRVTEESLQASDGTVLHYSRYEYDHQGNRTLVQTGDQKTTTTYNSQGQPIEIIDALNHSTHISYNDKFYNLYGQRVLQKTTTDPLGYQTVETYDVVHRLVESCRLNPFGTKVGRQLLHYDLCGNQTRIEDEVIEEGKVLRTICTRFAYDPVGQMTQCTEGEGTPEQKITRIFYNAYGQKEALTKPDGIEIRYTYDPFERLKTVTSSDQSVSYRYDYNLLDQVICVTDQNTKKATQREYFQGDLKKETLANGLTLDYTYDRTGRARTITFPDRTGIEYIYNAVDLKEIYRIVKGERTYVHKDLTHSLSGEVTQAKLPGKNEQISYHFDPLRNCRLITSQAFHQIVPPDGIDPAGNLLKFEIQNAPYAFSYDDHYQIKSEVGHRNHAYTYDSLENRTSKDEEKYLYNALNQLMKKGEQHLVYDQNGNLIRNGPYQYVYDALNRLIKVSSNGICATYSYDAFDRRIAKTVNGLEELFLYQGQDEIGTWKSGVCQDIRLMGKNKLSRTAALEIRGIAYVPIHDLNGNIAMLLNLQGDIIEQYRYTAYGEPEILGPSGEKRLQSAIGNPWQYAGKRIDEESGLIAFGMRYYDPQLGRWISPDPAGFVDGSNLYAYVHNNSLRYLDQFGLFSDILSYSSNGWFPFLEDNYQHYCTPLGPGKIDDLQFGSVWHFNIEDKLEAEHNSLRDPFLRSEHCHINDFKDSKGNFYNFPELPAGKGIAFMCGIGNTDIDFQASLLHIAELAGGYNVEGIFCPTYGLPLDYKCYEHSLRDNACFEGSRLFQKLIQDFHGNNPANCTLLAFFHSRGNVYGRNGLIDSPQELRNRVEVGAFAPGAYIDPSLCKSVTHYVSKRDPVPNLDKAGRARCKDTIITLQPHPKAVGLDHSFTSPTYAPRIKGLIEDYMAR